MKVSIRHPDYDEDALTKWRLCYEAGDEFIDEYLEQFSAREDNTDFQLRQSITYAPAFAKAAINDIKNAIFQRIPVVTREGGPQSWLDSCRGLSKGVDLKGSTMTNFIGLEVISELLVMKRVGIFIDREPIDQPISKADIVNHPYLYIYRAEDILSWAFYEDRWEIKAVLLRDYREILVDGLPSGDQEEIYRHCYINLNNEVQIDFYDTNSKLLGTKILKLSRLPFVIAELNDSLMKDVANYQIALLNLASSDIAFCLKGNFPFYTEQSDPRASGTHLKKSNDSTPSDAISPDDSIKVGAMHGRRYPKGVDRPDFIAPPTGPLEASMAKQQNLKDEIRLLVNLSLANVKPKMASAESKSMDERGLEAGLSYIGMALEQAERQIAVIWAAYEGSKTEPTVRYPERYNLKSDNDILEEAKKLKDRMYDIPSDTYKREMAKQIANTLLGSRVSTEVLDKMLTEIDRAKVLITDPDVVMSMVESALLSNSSAAVALGAPKDEPIQAAKDHAERAKRILEAQVGAAARGVKDIDPNPNSGKIEKDKVNGT